MGERVIVAIVVIFLLIIISWMLYGSGLLKVVRNIGQHVEGKVDEVKEKNEVMITDPPTIYYKKLSASRYTKVMITKKAFKLGRSQKCDLLLEDPKIEMFQAEIVKRTVNDSEPVYCLINRAKVNPTEVYDIEEDVYTPLYPNEKLILNENNAFYMGDTKFIVKLHEKLHRSGETERVMRKKALKKKATADTKKYSQRERCLEEELSEEEGLF